MPTPIQFDRAVLRAELPRSDKAARRWPLIDSDPHADQPRQLDSRHACVNSEVDNLAALFMAIFRRHLDNYLCNFVKLAKLGVGEYWVSGVG